MTQTSASRLDQPTGGDIRLRPKEVALLSDCVTCIGESVFVDCLCGLCASLAGAESVFLTAFFLRESPLGIYSSHTSNTSQDALRLYTDVAYVLDPFYLHFQTSKADEVLALADVAPDEFRQSRYHQLVYEALGLQDECGLLVHITDATALFFSLGVHKAGQSTRTDRLDAMKPVICALARRHWSAFSREDPEGRGRVAAHLERAFSDFGASRLSPRESEIARLILRGHSNKSIARILGNSPETIKVHRRRIYAKLGVETQGQLLSLFLDALGATHVGFEGDPLLNLPGS